MLPPFDLQGGLPIVAARATAVAALLSAFGSLAFRVLVAPSAWKRMQPDAVAPARRRNLVVTQASMAAWLCAAIGWLILQSAVMADADTASQAFASVPIVLRKTLFGTVLLAQGAATLAASVLVGRRDRVVRQRLALLITGLALALQAGHSHAFSMHGGPSLLLVAEILHLLGAGGWLGALLPLILLVRTAPPAAAAAAARQFAPFGRVCVGLLLISAGFQGWVLVGSIPGLIGTAYGWLVLVKLVLFAVLLGFAAANRYRFAPSLLGGSPGPARSRLVRSIAVQSAFAAAIVVAAAILSALPPSMHEQALWPFADRFSLDTVREDPDFLREVLGAGAVLGVAATLLVASLVWRRGRLAACLVLAVTAWFAVPHFDLLLAEAYPTSFYRSPSGFMAAGIVEGAASYRQDCVACHGAGGAGDGVAAATLPVPPADLTAPHLWMHSDGELFWWISHGIEAPDGGSAMPGFAGTLDDSQVWSVIDFIRARNAGDTVHRTGQWSPIIPAPGFGMQCGGVDTVLSQLRGHYVRLVFGTAPASPTQDAVTILVGPDPARLRPGTCGTQDATVAGAYAVIARMTQADLPGAQFLIDPSGQLRAIQLPHGPAGWNNPAILASEIAALRAYPAGQDSMAMPICTTMSH